MASFGRRLPRKASFQSIQEQEYEYSRLVVLRALSADTHFKPVFSDLFTPDFELDCLGVESTEALLVEWLGIFAKVPAKITAGVLRKAIKAALAKAEAGPVASSFRRNIDWLGDMIGLGPVDRDILELAIAIRQNEMLQRVLDASGEKTLRADCDLIGRLIQAPAMAVAEAFSRKGNLIRYGFLSYDHYYDGIMARVEMQTPVVAKIAAPYATQDELVSAFLNSVADPELTADDMPHMADHLATLTRLLPQAMASGRKGVNILLYGEPGTGKSQMAALLAREAGLAGYQILKPDDDEPQGGNERLGYYLVVQRMLRSRRDAVLVFDEFEDVVPDNDLFAGMFGGGGRKSAPMKSFLTRILEENEVPTIWICNRIGHMDRALLRRFTYAVEFRTPPAGVRRRILQQAVAGIEVDPRWIDRMANVANLSPALMRNAATVVALAGTGDRAANEALLDRTIAGSLRALGERPRLTGLAPVTRYDLAFVNAAPGVEAVASSLRRTGRGTLCFYGPPGTGKSALAGHLAQQLGRPLVVRRASDLLSKWVGEAEQNIARMFEEARDENAVLLVDEADSFLADRAGAQRSWEITQVNEMLSQIEHFDGVLICTTNRLDHMDPAVLRRFSHKVGFSYLTAEQRLAMFFSEFGEVFPEDGHRFVVSAALAPLANLAPGDFATVRRQFDGAGGSLTLDELLAALAAECSIKPDRPRRTVGFV